MCKSFFLKCGLGLLFIPIVAYGDSSIGEIADNLLGPTSLVTKLVEVACIIIGLTFLFIAFAQYKIHRQNPKLVPLMTPVLLVVLGFIALLIPYATTLTKTGRTDVTREETTNLPMPDVNNRGARVPYPPYNSGQSPQGPSSSDQTWPPPSDQGGGGGSWTNDPRYNR